MKTNQNLKSTTNLLNRDLPKSENKTSKQTKKMYILPNQLPSTGNLEKYINLILKIKYILSLTNHDQITTLPNNPDPQDLKKIF